MFNSLFTSFLSLLDPYILLVPQQVEKRVKQEENKLIKKVATINHVSWFTIYVLAFFLADYNKANIELWATFRFGLAFSIAILGLVSFIFRRNIFVTMLNIYLMALIIPLGIAWSMSFVTGFDVGTIWICVIPAFLLLSVSRSLVISSMWLIFIVLVSSPLWGLYASPKRLAIDTIFSFFLLILGYVTKKNWLQSKVNQFLHDDVVQESIEKQIEFDNEIKRFISPVLVKRIEEKTSTGQTLVMALDDVLMRKEAPVAVMFTDMRNFSTRSVDIDFVEHELVPSSSKIIDGAEDNMGIAKQIGDAVFVYYAMDDAEEGLLRATKDAVKGCLDEKQRIKTLGRTEPERFFSIAYGPALVGNMASFRHREATVIGSPANLSARIDTLTKEPALKVLIDDGNKVLVSKTAKEILKSFNDKFEFNEVNLEDLHLIMKSFPDEKTIYLLTVTEQNINALNDILTINNIRPIEANS